jgi:succinate dehydrogenase (ubiquinone) membrane anchor subunit
MASIMRPGFIRQAVQSPAASQRMLSTMTSSINRPLAQLRPTFQRSALPSTRIAALHATQRKKIIGTTNDPTPVPDPDYKHGSYHWSFERWA